MHQRRRYLAVRLVTEDSPPSDDAFREALWRRLNELYGELGVSRIGFWLVVYDPSLRAAIIRCRHDQVRMVRAALATITHIGESRLILHVVGISGTIRKAKTLIPGMEAHKDPNRKPHH